MLPFYGRKLSRRVNNVSICSLKKCKYFFDEINFKNLQSKLEVSEKIINLEIGFGMGDHLVYLSQKHKNEIFIALDPFLSGNEVLRRKIDKNKIRNIFFSNLDFLSFLNFSKRIYFTNIFIFFPDPWPKSKHKKRRLINYIFVKRIKSILKNNSRIFVVTDHKDYSIQIYESFKKNRFFESNFLNSKNLVEEEKNFYPTKYFYKAKRELRNIYYFIFTKK